MRIYEQNWPWLTGRRSASCTTCSLAKWPPRGARTLRSAHLSFCFLFFPGLISHSSPGSGWPMGCLPSRAHPPAPPYWVLQIWRICNWLTLEQPITACKPQIAYPDEYTSCTMDVPDLHSSPASPPSRSLLIPETVQLQMSGLWKHGNVNTHHTSRVQPHEAAPYQQNNAIQHLLVRSSVRR